MSSYFVSAIGTDSGKTLVSALLTHLLEADYWKPIQAGTPYDKDTLERLGRKNCRLFPSSYTLAHPESPHSAAEKEGIEISLENIRLPETNTSMIVEGAGGLLVPINQRETIADLILALGLPLLLVSDYYLGSINHTLLSLEYCKQKGLPLGGIIMNGQTEAGTRSIIERKANCPIVLEVPKFPETSREKLAKWAKENKNSLKVLLSN